jgi:D-alanyl-D-alanine carboxypeptidase/D-alanyl-D-alanine-endopeptidase (penicillin-binding protein 4)
MILRSTSWASLLLALVLAFIGVENAFAIDPLLPGTLRKYVEEVVGKESAKFQIGIQVSHAMTGQEVYAYDSKTQLVPASVMKIITSVAALGYLGAEYRFPTEFFVDSLAGDISSKLNTTAGLRPDEKDGVWSAGNLYVRGYGDPSLTEDQLYGIVEKLRGHGISEVENIVLDDSLFIDPARPTGSRPYQAGQGALSFNHNCYRVRVSPNVNGGKAFVSLTSGLDASLLNRSKTLRETGNSITLGQTPSSVSFNPNESSQKLGNFRILPKPNISVKVSGRIGRRSNMLEFYQTVPSPSHYLGSVLRHLMENAGIRVRGQLLSGETPGAAKLLFVHESKALKEILVDLNHYSSNFIAGQVVYALGQDSVGFFRKDLGLSRVAAVLEGLGFKAEEFSVDDGSGLSRKNRLTAKQFVDVLVAGYQDFSMSPLLISSLSRFSESGTLVKRKLLKEMGGVAGKGQTYLEELRRAKGVWGKTGTLTGVSSLAGYAESRDGERLAYAIIINGSRSKRRSMEIENGFMKRLIDVNK